MLFWLLQACLPSPQAPENVDLLDNPAHDYDGDGYSEQEGDCNDNDPLNYVLVEYLPDKDGDGYTVGNGAITICDITPPFGYIWVYQSLGEDCNDRNARVHPNAYDYCDGVDNDCSGVADDVIDESTPWWYVDVDEDGFGRSVEYTSDGTIIQQDENGLTVALQSCSTPFGYVGNDDDCNDEDATNFPNNIEVCDGVDNNCNGVADEVSAADATIWYADVDGDGFPSGQQYIVQCDQPEGFIFKDDELPSDCDDYNAEISPDAIEQCNNKDDNCDGLIDNNAQIGLQTCYLDRDGDGYGDEDTIGESCECPSGSVDVGGDCDDFTASVFPGQPELCNGADDDCDGAIDNQAIDPTVYFEDQDGDGYGTGTTLLSCPQQDAQGVFGAPAGYAEDPGDCNDNNVGVNPGQPELCTLLIDENCDGKNVLGAIDYSTYWADADGDGFGNSTNQLEICISPVGYIEVDPNALPPEDCDDADDTTFPGAPELCNGKLDDCANANGALSVPTDEIDGDGDTFLDCNGKVFDPTAWVGDVQVLTGYLADGIDRNAYRDCDDTDGMVYPFAVEVCDGLFQDCEDTERGVFASPALERDDDGDGFVECQDFGSVAWNGDTAVVDGWDCDDTNPTTYPGAVAAPATYECFADDNSDGVADCSLDGTGSWSDCEAEVMLDYFGVQMDFALIPAGSVTTGSSTVEYGRKASNEPQVTVSFSQDWYAMTSEITQSMYEATSANHESIWKQQHDDYLGFGPELPIHWMSWHLLADFANQVTLRHNAVKGDTLMLCYDCTDSNTDAVQCEESINPYQCDGYRLPTYVEWEYMARGDTTDAFWTPDGVGHIPSGVNPQNPVNAVGDCQSTSWVFDGGNGNNNILSAYTLGDFAWYCANAGGMVHPVREKQPNFYGLYDIQGNVVEWTHDYIHPVSTNQFGLITLSQTSSVDVSGDASFASAYRNTKGGNYFSEPRVARIAAYGQKAAQSPNMGSGGRLVRSIVNPVE